MDLDLFDRNPYGTNCWLLSAEAGDEAVVVDPGFEPAAVHAMLEAADKRPVAVLLTHAHFDHAGAAGTFAGELPVFVHPDDVPAFADYPGWGGGSGSALDAVADLRTFVDGDVLRLAGLTLDVVHTPGHTPGSSCFRIEDEVVLLSGDLVFAGTIGRSDFANSDPAAMRRSLIRFLTLPDATRVLPGHGPETTVGAERASNPFLREAG
jgi:glyoxylase-like metal-dependent hydrolase (beta-lactamase superfamily II)